jgi:hypothetical protein
MDFGGTGAAAVHICDRTAAPHQDKRKQRTLTNHNIAHRYNAKRRHWRKTRIGI